MADVADRIDAFQRRHRALGLPIAVTYKFFDDQGNYLAAIITYYAFVAIFPLMLIASSVLGFILQGNPDLERDVLNSALSQFPIVGTELGKPEGLRGSTPAIVFGALAALYGALGLGHASQNAISVIQAIPRNIRFNPFISRFRSLLLLLVAGITILVVAVFASLASHTDVLGVEVGAGLSWVMQLASVAATALVLGAMVRYSSARQQTFREVLPGAVTVALLWQLLQSLGGSYVEHVVNKSDSTSGVFALVLGLLAFVYVAAVVAVVGLEINVVVAHKLYPRALLTPFTDAVTLTEADRRVYTEYAQAQRHKGFQQVHVDFDGGADESGELPGR